MRSGLVVLVLLMGVLIVHSSPVTATPQALPATVNGQIETDVVGSPHPATLENVVDVRIHHRDVAHVHDVMVRLTFDATIRWVSGVACWDHAPWSQWQSVPAVRYFLRDRNMIQFQVPPLAAHVTMRCGVLVQYPMSLTPENAWVTGTLHHADGRVIQTLAPVPLQGGS